VCMCVCVSLSLSMRVYGLSRGLMRPFTYSLSLTRTTLTQSHKVGVRERVYEHLYTRERGISSDVVCVCVCVCARECIQACVVRVDRHTRLVSIRLFTLGIHTRRYRE